MTFLVISISINCPTKVNVNYCPCFARALIEMSGHKWLLGCQMTNNQPSNQHNCYIHESVLT